MMLCLFVDGVVDTGPVGVEYHRVASRRLVLVGDLNTTISPVQETQVDLSTTPASTIPASIGRFRFSKWQNPFLLSPYLLARFEPHRTMHRLFSQHLSTTHRLAGFSFTTVSRH